MCDSSLFLVCVFLNASLRFFSVVVVVGVVFCLCELVGITFICKPSSQGILVRHMCILDERMLLLF